MIPIDTIRLIGSDRIDRYGGQVVFFRVDQSVPLSLTVGLSAKRCDLCWQVSLTIVIASPKMQRMLLGLNPFNPPPSSSY